MRGWRFVLLLPFAACGIDAVDLTSKSCPCLSGWVCDQSTNKCVPPGTSTSPVDGGTSGVDAAASNTYRDLVMGDRPIAYWRFEEDAGPIARDEMGKHDAFYKGPVALGRPGILAGGSAVEFPLSKGRSYISQSDPIFRFPGNVPYTVEVWVKAKSLNDYARLLSTEEPDSGAGWWIGTGQDGGRLAYAVTDGAAPIRQAIYNVNLPLDGFHHVVWIFKADGPGTGAVYLFLDGTSPQRGVDQWSPALDVGSLTWGCRITMDGPVNCLDGVIDEAAIYDYALSETQVASHVLAGRLR
jgi:hypothetical protein